MAFIAPATQFIFTKDEKILEKVDLLECDNIYITPIVVLEETHFFKKNDYEIHFEFEVETMDDIMPLLEVSGDDLYAIRRTVETDETSELPAENIIFAMHLKKVSFFNEVGVCRVEMRSLTGITEDFTQLTSD